MFEWLVKEVANAVMAICAYAVGIFMHSFDFNLGYFTSNLPIVGKSYEIFQTMALGLVMLFFIWQCFKIFGAPIGIESDDPVKVFFKSILAVFCIYNAQGIFNEGFTTLRPIFDSINDLGIGATLLNNPFEGYKAGHAINDLLTLFTAAGTWEVIVFVIILVVIMWNLLKMLIELTERYVLMGILAVTSPLGFSMMTTKATANIFAAWTRMIMGQFVIYLLNFWIIKAFLSAFTQVRADIVWLIFMWAFLKVAQKLDMFLGKLGIEVGNVGGSLIEELMVAKTVLGVMGKGGFGGAGGKAGGIAAALSAAKGGGIGGFASVLARRATGGVASALANGTPVGRGGVVGRAAMGALGAVTKNSLLGGLLFSGNPLNGGKFASNALNSSAFGIVGNSKAKKAAKILNENPVIKGGGEAFSKELKNLTSQKGITENLVNQLNRDVGGENGKQIMKGLIGKKSFGDLKPDMVDSPGFTATAFHGGVKWSYSDAGTQTTMEGVMAVHGNNNATKVANRFKNGHQDAFHYTSNAPGGRKISCVYTKSEPQPSNQSPNQPSSPSPNTPPNPPSSPPPKQPPTLPSNPLPKQPPGQPHNPTSSRPS
jgi:hypothetical protein